MIKAFSSSETFKKNLSNLFKARFPIIYIQTYEENRAIEIIKEIATNIDLIKTPRNIYAWSSIQNVKRIDNNSFDEIPDTQKVNNALNFIDNIDEPAILILKDIHNSFIEYGHEITNRTLVRYFREVAMSIKQDNFPKNIVMISPTLVLPLEIEKDITIIEFDLPTLEEIKNVLNQMIEVNQNAPINIDLNEEQKEILCKGALGLTLQEAENAFAKAMISNRKLTIDELDVILDEKYQIIKKTEVLEYVKTSLNMDDIGGLDNLKNWLSKRTNSWLDKAQIEYNLPAPKGVLITGIPGCGKSLTAKAISEMWKMPLLRLDIGKIFNKYVGNSEENIRKAIKTAEAVAPAILWIDEVEKGFSGINSNSDDGTAQRIFGTFLTWLQEKNKPVFVIATSNNISALPPEFLRKGRFDEIFFVDLPTYIERKNILKLHIDKILKGSISENKFELSDLDLDNLAKQTEGFSGAEIEQVVISSVFEAFSESRVLEFNDLIKSIKNTIPMSVMQTEEIEAIRKWADKRAVSASKNTEFGQDKRGGRKIGF